MNLCVGVCVEVEGTEVAVNYTAVSVQTLRLSGESPPGYVCKNMTTIIGSPQRAHE